MLGPIDVGRLFVMLETSGCRPPDVLREGGQALDIALETWVSALCDLDADTLKRAALAYLRSPDARFWPTPGQLLALVPARQAAAIDDADNAWAWLLRLVQRRGYYQGPPERFSPDDAKEAAFRAGLQAAGGWHALCQAEETQTAAVRASFRAAYRATMQRAGMDSRDAEVRALIERGGKTFALLEGGKS